jgi:hypothetical protein
LIYEIAEFYIGVGKCFNELDILKYSLTVLIKIKIGNKERNETFSKLDQKLRFYQKA